MEKKLTKEEFIKRLNNKRYNEYLEEYNKYLFSEEQRTLKEKSKIELQLERSEYNEKWVRSGYFEEISRRLDEHFNSKICVTVFKEYFFIDGHKKKDWKRKTDFYCPIHQAVNMEELIEYLESKGVQ